ncbi:MAG: hypothetical protein ABR574_07535 [Cryomorphaceae bacterium]
MEWRRSSLFILTIFLLATGVAFADGGLNGEEWDKLRDGISYNEESLPEVEQNQDSGPSPISALLLTALRVLGFVAIIGLLVFFLVRLLTGKKKNTAISKPKVKTEAEEELPTASSPMEVLWASFKAARNTGDYKECLRLLYQISLKQLENASLIKTEVDKTNWDYVTEIREPKIASGFSSLTAIHEYTWYGMTEVDESTFLKFEPRFLNFIEIQNREE